MLAEAAIAVLSDDDISELLASRTPEAHRLATWILRDPDATEDAVQEAAMAAWDGRKRLRHADNPTAWFTTIVVNVCRDELRRRSKRRTLPEPPAPIAGGSPDLLAVRDEIGRAIARPGHRRSGCGCWPARRHRCRHAAVQPAAQDPAAAPMPLPGTTPSCARLRAGRRVAMAHVVRSLQGGRSRSSHAEPPYRERCRTSQVAPGSR